MRTKMVVANWKMNKTPKECKAFFRAFSPLYKGSRNREVVIAPSYICLPQAELSKPASVKLSAQNVSGEASGAYTGEISVEMLKAIPCDYVIIGHSERRLLFHESDEEIQKKVVQVIRGGLGGILCVGETRNERKGHQTLEVITRQLKVGLQGLTSQDLQQVTIAYEPVWAIGTGEVATAIQVEEVHRWIREFIWNKFGIEEASNLRIIYGGSVKAENIYEIASKPNVDGALIGGASLEAKTFIEILERIK
ncbi:MAG: triose-phosphate isomerase [Deltaproteobacteria bacterium]|nr:triose-phosphate isomerase [Deltaproteobacteria bacterium]